MSRPLHRFFGRADALSQLQDHARQLQRLQQTLAAALPPALAESCQVVNLQDAVLAIHCHHGATAVRLKQLLPRLLRHFAADGHDVRDIRLRVRPFSAGAPPSEPAIRSLSPQARAHIDAFAASLPADAPLRQALERLSERSRA